MFFKCSRTKFEVLIVNLFICKILALQILCYFRTLLAFNQVFHALVFDFCVISNALNLKHVYYYNKSDREKRWYVVVIAQLGRWRTAIGRVEGSNRIRYPASVDMKLSN